MYPLDLHTNTIMETLAISMEEMTPERVVFSMPVTPRLFQPYGVMHGGVSVVLAETVASAGSVQFVDTATQMVVGQEINANHLRSVNKGTLRAIGSPVHIGKRTIVWEIKLYDDDQTLICISRCTIAIVNLRPTS